MASEIPEFKSVNDPKVAQALITGSIGVIPTDTVYGVAAQASDQQAVQRLYMLKSRENKPGTLIAASIEQLMDLGVKPRYLKAVEHFWPAAISIVIPLGFDLPYLHLGKQSLAMRVVAEKNLIKLLTQTGPLLTSSANRPGEPPAVDISEAKAYFGNRVDFYVDGGDMSGKKASTVIRIVDDAVEILRQGAVTIDESGRTNSEV
jgi:L-threonylcarbamoyladenylate synthase